MPKPKDSAAQPGAKAREQKAAAASEKERKAANEKAAQEEAEWSAGANTKAAKRKEEEEAAKREKAARKAEADAQLKAEEEEAMKQKVRGAEKVAARQAQKVDKEQDLQTRASAAVLSGSGIDAALAVMTLATTGGGGSDDVEEDMRTIERGLMASEGALVDADDKHPEKRAKAAFARFRERELPLLKKECVRVRCGAARPVHPRSHPVYLHAGFPASA
jgi:Coiled-coil domain-containing protein 124 /Oxs1